MQGEHPYYAGLSGLAPAAAFSVADHKQAYWTAQTALPATASLSDLERSFIGTQTGLDAYSLLDTARLQYWRTVSGLPNAGLSEAMHAAFGLS